ncbi:hypothetical protein V2J09_020336, partial [Rumex salicifolius]
DGVCTDSSKPSSLTSTCYPRYISDSYFKKHHILVDSDFKHFLSHELNLASSQSLMTVSNLQLDVTGEGSHRHLSSFISFSIQQESIAILSKSICEVIIVEKLPSGVFADPFELEHLIHRGVFKDAAVFGDTNLELPSFMSNRSVVEIHMHTPTEFSTLQKNAFELKIEIPVHARYQPLDDSGYTRVQFGPPDLLLRCNVEEGQSDVDSCMLTSFARDPDVESGPAEWIIPSGTEAHGLVVSVLTFCSALVAAASIIAASLLNSESRILQGSKQS